MPRISVDCKSRLVDCLRLLGNNRHSQTWWFRINSSFVVVIMEKAGEHHTLGFAATKRHIHLSQSPQIRCEAIHNRVSPSFSDLFSDVGCVEKYDETAP